MRAATAMILVLCTAGCGSEQGGNLPTPIPATPTVIPVCVQAGEHCVEGVPCCAGLGCCAGFPLPPGGEVCGSVCPVSDRQQKTSIEPVNADRILDHVTALPIQAWSYTNDPHRVRHLGPMAQDFAAILGFGASQTCIPTVDAQGVALASIQALNERLEALRHENEQLTAETGRLHRRLDRLETRLRKPRRR